MERRRRVLTILAVAGLAFILPLIALRACTPGRLASVAGVEPGQRALNGPQTTGRAYRNLSEPAHTIASDRDVAVSMRDGTVLRADVHRPAGAGRFPVLIAASPYPRQIQDLGAPLGFLEAGRTEFFVPRGYVHVIASLRGTGGSGGVFGFFDAQERRDMHDLVEWAAQQPWSDGNVGMIGVSYFAMTQLEAAVERPPHLKAIFPLAVTADLYEGALRNGLMSSSFVTPFLAMTGMNSTRTSAFWNSAPFDLLRRVLALPPIHARFATMNGEAALTGLKLLVRLPHDPHPWDDLWRSIAVEHPVRDAWWDERNLLPLLDRVQVPVYLGCDWDNVPLHLPATFTTYGALTQSPHVRMALPGEHGLAWPWESLHVEALAWYDHWLKGRDTGILDGPRVRYVLPGGGDDWRSAETWPVPGTQHRAFALRADGALGEQEDEPGARALLTLGAGLSRPRSSPTDPPGLLVWTSEPLREDLDVVGEIELRLDATSTATDTAWFAILQDVDPQDRVRDVTQGQLRASLRQVDEASSRVGAPVLESRVAELVPIGQLVHYRVPLVPNARRFEAGHRLRLVIASDDQNEAVPAMLGFRHASVGTSSLNTIHSSSRLLLPILP